MARVVIAGSGCRGLALARGLRAEGHAVRAITRSEERRAEIEATGAECYIGDPDRIGTVTRALDNATILCWLLAGATGPPEKVRALHGSRLQMLLERTIDTTVRGLVYEDGGGAEAVRRACEYSEIPHRVIAPGEDPKPAVDALLGT